MKHQSKIPTLVLVLLFVAGLALLSYPALSSWWNDQVQTRAVAEYDAAVDQQSEESHTAELAQAKAYNEALAKLPAPFLSYDQVPGYEEALNVLDTGMMGYITIPTINVKLAIYHTTTDAVLNSAVGHLQGSSLPVGGAGTHAVIVGHTGLPTSRLFTDIDKLAQGDYFCLHVLGEELWYAVDNIAVVEPDDVELLAIEPDADLCTLMTCTPYGINTHRLLVRGHRTEAPAADALPADEGLPAWVLPAAISLAIVVAAAVTVVVVIVRRRRLRNRHAGLHTGA